jgi:hypothetical protein
MTNLTGKVLVNKITDVLFDWNLFDDVSYNDFENKIEIKVFVERGDWKHDHLCVVHLIADTFCPDEIREEVIEEDGSDCYSAVHIFTFYKMKGCD